MTAYYNEFDPYAAQWLRNLIAAGHIADGVVDERSIEDVRPSDLKGFTQCHFFAGVGVWSYALRNAGWPDDRPAWTGSCPCQPFSEAGAGAGFTDERHLWPAFFHLIEQCKPAVVFGEQVAKQLAKPWLELVQDDVEALDYAFGAAIFPSAGIGAPHIRERLYWCAYAEQHNRGQQAEAASSRKPKANRPSNWVGRYSGVADWASSSIEWVACSDGRARPIKPGLCAVVDEYPGRVGRLRAYGNAICASQAQIFIEAAMSHEP